MDTGRTHGADDGGGAGGQEWINLAGAVGKWRYPHTDLWDGNMAGATTFAGLFAGVVAAFLLPGLQGPDPQIQLLQILIELELEVHNMTKPASFPDTSSSATSALINGLWTLALILSVSSALLATLFQSWTSIVEKKNREIAANADPDLRALINLRTQLGLQRYALGAIAWVTLGSLHLAVLTFFIGLVLYVRTLSVLLTLSVAVPGCAVAAFYTFASLAPLCDPHCPSETPLTYLILLVGRCFTALLSVPLFYGAFAVRLVVEGKVGEVARLLLHHTPSSVTGAAFSAGAVPLAAAGALLRGSTPQETIIAARDIKNPLRFNAHEVEAMLTYLWAVFKENPASLFRIVESVDFAGSSGIEFIRLLANIRQQQKFVDAIMRALTSVESQMDGLGSIELLTCLFYSGDPSDVANEFRKSFHWRNIGSIERVFEDLAKKISRLVAAERAGGGRRIDIMISAFRWRLMSCWQLLQTGTTADVERSSATRRTLEAILIRLEQAPGLGTIRVFADEGGLEAGGFPEDLCYCYGRRNALTLLKHVIDICPESDWQRPGARFLREEDPDMWSWPKYRQASNADQDKSPASADLVDLLHRQGLLEAAKRDPSLPAPRDSTLGPFTLRALRDILRWVDPTTLTQTGAG